MSGPAVLSETHHLTGLTTAQVEASRQQHGTNVLTPPPRDPWWKLFLEKFDDPVIRILLIAAVIAIGVGSFHGEYLEGIGIIVAVLLATGLAFINELKANNEFDILNQVNDEVPFNLIRNGGYTTIPMRDIVVGDVVFVEVGEEVPADGDLAEAVSLQVMESALTGEPDAKRKVIRGQVGSGQHDAAIPAHRMMRGTKVMDGHGIMIVTEVGDATEIGKTARAAVEETGEVTPLNQQLEKLSQIIGVVGLLVAVITYAALVVRGSITGDLVLSTQQWNVVGIFTLGSAIGLSLIWAPMVFDGLELLGESMGKEIKRPKFFGGGDDDEGGNPFIPWFIVLGLGAAVLAIGLIGGAAAGMVPSEPANWLPPGAGKFFLDYFMIAVTIIVVAVPEGLAMSVTLSLAYSMRKMTAANTLVRKLHACETIGAATVICSDKTGTLTMNEMRVFETQFPALSGGRLQPDAQVGKVVIDAISANTTAQLNRSEAEPQPIGNPTEGALLLWLHDQGVDYSLARTGFNTQYQLTFSTERKFMATHGVPAGSTEAVIHVKGAPEIVLSKCTSMLTAQGKQALDQNGQRADVLTALKGYQARGMRTLGFAYHNGLTVSEGMNLEEVTQDLTWLGFVAIADPVRNEVPAAIAACRKAGIKVKMVTGDNPDTAQEISRQIGLWHDGDPANEHLSGPTFDGLNDSDAEDASARLKILSRAKPSDKVKLVRSLQARGEVVAVTGDGINDCGALNYANVGLAMGKSGKAAAKEASDIILLDDSFRTIVNAVMWGRSLYQNIQRFILFQLTINVAALGVAMLGPFLGVAMPLTVTQMLWVNLIMDTFAALALATEPPHADVMNNPPRRPEDFIITGPMAKGIFGTGFVFLIVLIAMLLMIQNTSQELGLKEDDPEMKRMLTIFFSVFVMLQFWNLFNARCLGLTTSAFTGLWENKSLLLIAAAIFVGTIVFVQFGGDLFRTVPLNASEWVAIIAGTSVVLWIGELLRYLARDGRPAVS